MKIVKVLPLVAAMMLTGCVSMSPFYDRPQAPVAGAWPEGAAYEQAKLNQTALPDWKSFYTDARLREVIQMTLDHNRDYRVALLNVERLRQAYNIQRSEYLPYLAATADGTHKQTPASLSN